MQPTPSAADHRLAAAFAAYATGRLHDCLSNIERCIGLLTAEQVWHRPNEVSNSVGNLVLHLTGNVRQWVVAGIAGEPFERDRPSEFSERGPLPAEQISPPLRQTVEHACDVIEALSPESLLREYRNTRRWTIRSVGFQKPAT